MVAVEDPIAYRLDGIAEVNVNRKANLDFATGLRSILGAHHIVTDPGKDCVMNFRVSMKIN